MNGGACPETLGVSGDGEQGLGSGLEQQVIDHGLVLISDVADRCRQGEYKIPSSYSSNFSIIIALKAIEDLPANRMGGAHVQQNCLAATRAITSVTVCECCSGCSTMIC